jgi:hypothetical protein
MTTATAVIEKARDMGVRLAIEGGKLIAQGPPRAVDHLLPTLREHKPELLASLSEAVLNETSGHWLIIGWPTETEQWFIPPVTRAELESRHPGAVLVPLPDSAPVEQKKLTPAELDELATLVALVAEHYSCLPEDLGEMRTAATRDPFVALTSFRAIARGLGLERTEHELGRLLTADQWLSLGEERKTQP